MKLTIHHERADGEADTISAEFDEPLTAETLHRSADLLPRGALIHEIEIEDATHGENVP